MQLSKKQINQLIRIIETTQQILAEANRQPDPARVGARPSGRSKPRRSGKELAAFKKTIVAERKRGVPVAELAEKHGVTPSYIYQL
jgi:hypothetical protein